MMGKMMTTAPNPPAGDTDVIALTAIRLVPAIGWVAEPPVDDGQVLYQFNGVL